MTSIFHLRARRRALVISPVREDPFANGGATPAAGSRGFAQVMKEQQLKAVEADLSKQMKDRAKEGTLKVSVASRNANLANFNLI